MTINVKCSGCGEKIEYENAVAVPPGCPECGGRLDFDGEWTEPTDTRSDKV